MGDLNNLKFSFRWVGIILIAAALGIAFMVIGKKVPEVKNQTSAIEAEITSLKTTEDNLAELLDNQEQYRKDTREKEANVAKILEEFPTFMYLEDKILFADQILNDKNGLGNYTIKDFSYGNSNYVTSVAVNENVTLELYSVSLSGTYQEATYIDVKNLINYGFGSENRFVLRSITIGYNEDTGYLGGDLSFTTYFMPGQPDPYAFPTDILAELGDGNRKDDLFGSRSESYQSTLGGEGDVFGDDYEEYLEGDRSGDLFGENDDVTDVVTNTPEVITN